MDELEYIVDDKPDLDTSQSPAKEKPLIPLFVESARWIRGYEVS